MNRFSCAIALSTLLAAPGLAWGQDSYSWTPTAAVLSGPAEESDAPDFSLRWADKNGLGPVEQAFSLGTVRGKTVVLAFYPRDFTEQCTAQMRTFTSRYAELFGPNVVVVGVGADPLETHARWAASLGLPFRLASDPGQLVAASYGSKDRGGNNRRTVYVIGRDGTVSYRDMHFKALDSGSYDRLKSAVKKAERR